LGPGAAALATTLTLACFVGSQVVSGVTAALPSPLMSVTNAISGLTAVGGLILLRKADGPMSVILAVVGTAVSAINIFGGFVVSQRMLNLFKRPGDVDYSFLYLVPGVVFILFSIASPKDLKAIQVLCGLLCIIAIGGLASMKTANAGCKIATPRIDKLLFSNNVETSAAPTPEIPILQPAFAVFMDARPPIAIMHNNPHSTWMV